MVAFHVGILRIYIKEFVFGVGKLSWTFVGNYISLFLPLLIQISELLLEDEYWTLTGICGPASAQSLTQHFLLRLAILLSLTRDAR